MRNAPAVQTFFSELYAAQGKEPLAYFRIKSLELLYQLQKLRMKTSDFSSYYTNVCIQIVK